MSTDGSDVAATSRRREHGMVTAEAAMVLPVLVALTAALAWVVTLGIAQVRLVDAAREAARLAARGEPSGVVQQAALAEAPAGSRLSVRRDGDTWQVEVRADVGADVPLLGALPPVGLNARAVSVAEPSATDR